MADELNVINSSERCRHLLSQEILMNAGLPPGEKLCEDDNFWCGNTQTVFGPDRQVCDETECCSSTRHCYEAP